METTTKSTRKHRMTQFVLRALKSNVAYARASYLEEVCFFEISFQATASFNFEGLSPSWVAECWHHYVWKRRRRLILGFELCYGLRLKQVWIQRRPCCSCAMLFLCTLFILSLRPACFRCSLHLLIRDSAKHKTRSSPHHPSPITHHLISLAPELQSPESVVVSRQIDFLTSKKPTTYGTYVLYLVYSPARQLLSSKLARAIDSSTSKPNNEPLHSFLSYVQSESQMCTFTCSNPPSFFFFMYG